MPRSTIDDAKTIDASPGATFLVTHTWPDLRNAEYEVLQRLSVAASNIGATMIAVDNDGYPLWSNQDIGLDGSRPIDPATAEFMISLHFESPRLIDIHSYYALWNPLEFYFQFGYEQSLKKMLSHHDCLSCLSDAADAHGRTTFGAREPLPPGPFPTLFHNVPQPYLQSRIGAQSRLFYIGINWERGGRAKGRHSGLFERLDGEDILDIYGPRKLMNFEPWEGFKSYRGELPFDGLSTVAAINKAGICLALSSEAHRRSGLMSNRLFEGLGAGAAVILDSNRWGSTHFADIAYFVDDRASADDLADQIKAIVEGIRRDPEAASDRVRRGQARLAENFSLEGSLRELIRVHPERRDHHRGQTLASGSVTVVLTHLGSEPDDLLKAIRTAAGQTMVSIDLTLICDEALYTGHRAAIEAEIKGAVKTLTPLVLDLDRAERSPGLMPARLRPTGPMTAKALENLTSDYFCLLRSDECWFQDHLASLIGAIRREPGAVMAASGSLKETPGLEKAERAVSELRFVPEKKDFWKAGYGDEFGRFLFDRSVADNLPIDCLALLDGQEANLIRLTAALGPEPAQTGYATFVQTARAAVWPESIIPIVQQKQYVRDALAFDPRWLAKSFDRLQHPILAPAFNLYRPHPGVSRIMPLGVLLETCLEGEGLKYIEQGFSAPEKEGIWIDSKFATLEIFHPEMAQPSAGDLDLIIYMRGRDSHESGKPQKCAVNLNGVAIGRIELSQYNQRYVFPVPRTAVQTDGRMRIKLKPDHNEEVLDGQGRVIDPRPLAIHVQRFGLKPRVAHTPTIFTAKTEYTLAADSVVLAALSDGTTQADSVQLSRAAELSFSVEDHRATMALVLWLTDETGAAPDMPQQVSISLNGCAPTTFAIDATETRIATRLDGPGPHVATLEFQRFVLGAGPQAPVLAATLHRLQITETTIRINLKARIKQRLKHEIKKLLRLP